VDKPMVVYALMKALALYDSRSQGRHRVVQAV